VKIKAALFLIESPLNLLCAWEAVDSFQLDLYKFIIRINSEDKNNKQMLSLLSDLKIRRENITFASIKSEGHVFFRTLPSVKFTAKCLIKSLKFDKVFIGNLDSKLLNFLAIIIGKKKVIVYDDGTKTLVTQRKFNNRYYFNLFTMYDLNLIDQQVIYTNNFNRIRQLIGKVTLIDEGVMLLGGKWSEEGIISERNYFLKIQKICHIHKDKKIMYIPHRSENEDKLRYIASIANLAIKKLEYPVELYGIYNEDMPKKIISFASTALITMKTLYKVDIESYRFEFNHPNYNSYLEIIYKYYESRVPVFDLD